MRYIAMFLLLTLLGCGGAKHVTGPCGDGDNDRDDLGCNGYVIQPPKIPFRPRPFAADGCTVTTIEKGIYSARHGDEIYFVINMSNTDWFSGADSLVLLTNTTGPVEIDGSAARFSFAPSNAKTGPTWIKVEVDQDECGSSGWVRAETQTGCFLGSFFFPFGHGNN